MHQKSEHRFASIWSLKEIKLMVCIRNMGIIRHTLGFSTFLFPLSFNAIILFECFCLIYLLSAGF